MANFLPFMDLFLHILSAEGFDLEVDAAGLEGSGWGSQTQVCVVTEPTGSEWRCGQSFLPFQYPLGPAEA